MSEFSYQLGSSVNKPLPPISDPLVDVDFCSSTGAAQTPPTLRINLSANGTATVEGVYSACNTLATSAVLVVSDSVFGTNATNAYGLFQEVSGSTAASVRVQASDTSSVSTTNAALLGPSDIAVFRLHPGIQYYARAVTTNSTGKLQVTVIGE